jgi:hypothetical protein
MDKRIKILLSCLLIIFLAVLVVHDEIDRRHIAVKGISTEKKSVSKNTTHPDKTSTHSALLFGITSETPTPSPEAQSTSASQDSSSATSQNSQNQDSDSGETQAPTPEGQEQVSITPTPTPTSAQVTVTPTPTSSTEVIIPGNGAGCTNQVGNTCVTNGNSANVGNTASFNISSPTPTPVVGAFSSGFVTVATPTPTPLNTGGVTTVNTGDVSSE